MQLSNFLFLRNAALLLPCLSNLRRTPTKKRLHPAATDASFQIIPGVVTILGIAIQKQLSPHNSHYRATREKEEKKGRAKAKKKSRARKHLNRALNNLSIHWCTTQTHTLTQQLDPISRLSLFLLLPLPFILSPISVVVVLVVQQTGKTARPRPWWMRTMMVMMITIMARER